MSGRKTLCSGPPSSSSSFCNWNIFGTYKSRNIKLNLPRNKKIIWKASVLCGTVMWNVDQQHFDAYLYPVRIRLSILYRFGSCSGSGSGSRKILNVHNGTEVGNFLTFKAFLMKYKVPYMLTVNWTTSTSENKCSKTIQIFMSKRSEFGSSKIMSTRPVPKPDPQHWSYIFFRSACMITRWSRPVFVLSRAGYRGLHNTWV